MSAAADLGLTLPGRDGPRRGLTMMIDPGLPLGAFTDTVTSYPALVDVVKFGWGTSVVAEEVVRRKIGVLQDMGVGFFCGGTLLERAVAEDRPLADVLDDFSRFCEGLGAKAVEVSDGTIDLAAADKAEAIAVLASRFTVFAEVGAKDGEQAAAFGPEQWVAGIRADLYAGASYVITEARESGTSGIARSDGSLRTDVVDAISDAGIAPERLVFEAPTKALQVDYVRLFGPNVNLGNIAAADLVGLETLRLGLRSDTLLDLLPGARP